MITPLEWKWCGHEIVFRQSFAVHDPEQGKIAHEFMSPQWVLDIKLPDQGEESRLDIEAEVYKSGGTVPFNFHDTRVSYPKAAKADIFANPGNPPGTYIPAVTIVDMDAAGNAVVSGTAGDKITRGDPMAFTIAGQRIYFKALDTITLTGGNDAILVTRGKYAGTGINLALDREKPKLPFYVFINDIFGATRKNVTPISVRGVEYPGLIN